MKRAREARWATILLVVGIVFLGAVPGLAATINVEPGESIQDAINGAAVGDTIQVAAGTYSESNITINKSLTILGAPGDSDPGPATGAPIIDGGGVVADAFDLANGVSNVTISGFEIRNFGTNGWTNGSGVGIQAWVPSTSHITVSDNWFHDVGYGVMAGNDGSSAKYALGTHTDWTVSGNIIEEFSSIGVELTDTSNSSVQGNVIHMAGGSATGQIGIFSWVHISQSSLTVSGNTIDGAMVNYPAVYMYAYDDVAPTPNLNDVTIENNTISTTGSPFQVYLRDIGTGTVTGVHVNYNNLTGLNSLNNLTAVSIDAENNWWGDPDPSDDVSANVDYDPWYMDAAMTTLSNTRVHNVTQDTWYSTIQDAVDAAANAGDTINAAAGTYSPTATIVVNKSLTILGPQAGVDPRPSVGSTRIPGDTSTEAIIDGGGMYRIIKIEANNVIVDGVVVRNGTSDLIRQSDSYSGTTVRNTIVHHALDDEGIQLVNATGGLIEHNYVFDVAQDGLNFAYSTNSEILNNEVTGSNSENGAILVYNSENITISGNYVHDTTANNGIKLYTNTGAITVRNNLIVNNSWKIKNKHPDYSGNGILGYKATATDSTLTIEHNTISNNAVDSGSPYHFGDANFGNGIGLNSIPSYDSKVNIINNIVSFNGGWGVITKAYYESYGQAPTKVFINCNDVFENGAGAFSKSSVSYSTYTLGSNNISLDPLYGSDYTLQTGSPCIGAACDSTDIGAWQSPLLTPMTSFVVDDVKFDCKKEDGGKVHVKGELELATNKDISDDVVVTVGSWSCTINMEEKGKDSEHWEYNRPKGNTGGIKHMKIDWNKGTFDFEMDGLNLMGVERPVTISVQIGDDLGQATAPISKVTEVTIDSGKKVADAKVHVKGELGFGPVCEAYGSPPSSIIVSITQVETGTNLSWTISKDDIEVKGKEAESWEYKPDKHTDTVFKHAKVDWNKGTFDLDLDGVDLGSLDLGNEVEVSVTIEGNAISETVLLTGKGKKDQWKPQAIVDQLQVVAYPNPIRDVHTATFQVMGTMAAEVEEIRVQIYDLSGHLVWEDGALGSELDWHTDSLSGDYLANGIYLYRVQIRIGGSWINQDIGKIAVLR